MKTSININLFGTVYAIDEDAHNLLDQYLSNLKSYFSRQEGGDEISDDIEHRIAELFWELKQQGNESISIEQVTEILHKIGNPEEMESPTGDEPRTETSGNNERPRVEGVRQETPREERQGPRRFFRDGRDKILGGVLSGVCHYFGWNEPMLLRILFVLFCLFTDGIGVFLYILFWIIAPKAVTAEQRLMMQGKSVNPESIRSEVLNGATAGQGTPENNHSGCLKVLLGIFLAPFGCVTLFVLFVLLTVLFGLLMGAFGALTGIATGGAAVVFSLFATERWSIVIFVVCIILAIALPIYLLYRWLRRDTRPIDSTTTIIIVGCWLLAVIFGGYYGHDIKQKVGSLDWPSIVEEWDTPDWNVTIDDDSDHVYDQVTVDAFEGINFEGVGKLKFTQGDSCSVEISGNDWLKRHTLISTTDGVLNIELDDQARDNQNNKGLKIKVTAPCLTQLHVQGVGSVEVEGDLVQELPLDVKMQGVGAVEIDKVKCPRVSAEQEGIGKTEIDVETDSLIVKIEGIGKMEVSGHAKSYQRNATEMLSVLDDKDLKIGE